MDLLFETAKIEVFSLILIKRLCSIKNVSEILLFTLFCNDNCNLLNDYKQNDYKKVENYACRRRFINLS